MIISPRCQMTTWLCSKIFYSLFAFRSSLKVSQNNLVRWSKGFFHFRSSDVLTCCCSCDWNIWSREKNEFLCREIWSHHLFISNLLIRKFGSWSNDSVKRLKFRRLTEIIIKTFDQVKSLKKFGQVINKILIKW